MEKLIIIGASGFGREVAWLTERINNTGATWDLVGFLDDNEETHGKTVNGYPVLGRVEDAARYADSWFVCAVGQSKTRRRIIQRVKDAVSDVRFAVLIDPSVELSGSVSIGAGTIICAHSILTVNITVGEHVIINLDCTVGHDAVIHDYATLYPSVNISGNTTLGYCCEMGTGSQIIQAKTVGDETIVGAGAVVVSDIPPKCTAVGCPAKPIKYHA